MRLSLKEQQVIKKILKEIFGDVKIYIFGSRLDDSKKGGDVDIFLQISKPIKNKRAKRARAKLLLEEKLLKPIDIILEEDANQFIKKEAMQGVEL